MKLQFGWLGLASSILSLMSLSQLLQAADVPRILFVTQSEGFVHEPVKRGTATRSSGELAMMQLAKDSGEFTVVCSQDVAADFTPENLQKFDIVAFYTSGDLPISEANFEYFLKQWLPVKGHGFLAFHSATDTFKNFEPYWDLVGGTFNAHPWGANSQVTLKVHDTSHPAMQPFDGTRVDTQDEIYQYDHWQPSKVHVLMSLDMEHTQLKRPYHVPVAWCKQIGEGRMFYTNLGHRDSTWQNKTFLKSIVGAVRWIAWKEDGDATPNPEVSEAQQAESIQQAHAAGVTLESLELEQKQRDAVNAARRAAQEKAATK